MKTLQRKPWLLYTLTTLFSLLTFAVTGYLCLTIPNPLRRRKKGGATGQ